VRCSAFPRWTVWFTSIPARGRRERCPEDGLDLDDRKPGSNHTFGNRKSVVRVSIVLSIPCESESGSSRRAAMPTNCGNCKSISGVANPRPSPLAPAGGVGRGRTAMFSARSRFSKCDCFVLGLVVSFIAAQLLVRLVFDSSIRAVWSIAPRAGSKVKTRDSVHGTIFEMGSLHAPCPAEPIAATRNQKRIPLVIVLTIALVFVLIAAAAHSSG